MNSENRILELCDTPEVVEELRDGSFGREFKVEFTSMFGQTRIKIQSKDLRLPKVDECFTGTDTQVACYLDGLSAAKTIFGLLA